MSSTEVSRFIEVIDSIVRLRQIPESFTTSYQSIMQARKSAEEAKNTMIEIANLAGITSDEAKHAEFLQLYNDHRVRYISLTSKAESEEIELIAAINNFATKNGINIPRNRPDGSSFDGIQDVITYFNDAHLRSMSEFIGAINPQVLADVSNALESSRYYAAQQTSEILRLRSYINSATVSRVPEYSEEESKFVTKTSFDSDMVRFGALTSSQEVPQAIGPRLMDYESTNWVFVHGIIPLLTFAPLLYLSHPNLISILEIEPVSEKSTTGYRLKFENGLELLPRIKRGPIFDRNERLRVPNESVIISSIISLMEFLTNHGITFEWLSLSDFSIVANDPHQNSATKTTGRVVLRNFTRAIYCGDGNDAFTTSFSDNRNIIERSNNTESSKFLELLSSVLSDPEEEPINFAQASAYLPSGLVRRNLFFTAMLIEQLRRPLIADDLARTFQAVYVSEDLEQAQREIIGFCSDIISRFETVPDILKKFFSSTSVNPEFAVIAEEYRKLYRIESRRSQGTAVQKINKATITSCSEVMDLLSLLFMMIAVDLNLTYTQYFAMIEFLYLHADQIRSSLDATEKKVLKKIVKKYQMKSPFVTSDRDTCTDSRVLQHKVGAFIAIGLKTVLDVFGYNKHIPDVDWQEKIFSFFCTSQNAVDEVLYGILMKRSGNHPMALFGEPIFPRLSSEMMMLEMLESSTTCDRYRSFLNKLTMENGIINASIQQHSPYWTRVAYRKSNDVPDTEFYRLLSSRIRIFNSDPESFETSDDEEDSEKIPSRLSYQSSSGSNFTDRYSADDDDSQDSE